MRKAFGAKFALDGVDLRVEEGRILGLIGPNGAGKTTALKAMLGLTSYQGSLRVLGRPAVRISTGDFLRPASVRLEFGRTDPDAYYDGWVDEAGLRREVLDPTEPGGSGRIVISSPRDGESAAAIAAVAA